MIKKRHITEKELTAVMLSCDWHNWEVRQRFAQDGYFINVLIKDTNIKVAWTAAHFLSLEEYEQHKFSKKNIDPRRRY